MVKIAICGTMGSGKSTVSDIIVKKYPVFSCDMEAKKCYTDTQYMPVLKEILNVDYMKDGKVNYKLISDIIFNDKVLLKRVEKVIHEFVLNQINNLDDKLNFVEIPLLYELGWEKYFDEVILVSTSMEVALDRILATRDISYEEALKRLKLQINNTKQSEKANYVINNDGDLEALVNQVDDILRKIEERYGVKGER